MGEALMRWNAGRRFDVYSAGIRPTGVHPLARRVLEEIGVATGALRSTDLGSLLGQVGIDHAIVVCGEAEAACKSILPFARQRAFWPIDDPVVAGASDAEALATFRAARDDLDERIRAWLRGGLLAERA
jgi:arsenate reductase